MLEQDYKKYIMGTIEGWNKYFNCELRVDEIMDEELHCTLLHLMNGPKYYCTTSSWYDMMHSIDLIRAGMEIMLDYNYFTSP